MGRRSKPHRIPNGWWRCTIAGRQHYLGTNKAEAFRRFHQLMGQRGLPYSPAAPATVRKLILLWLQENTSKDCDYRIRSLEQFAGTKPLDTLKPDLLVHLAEHLRGTLAAATIKDRIGVARQCLRWAHKQGWIAIEFEAPRMPRASRIAKGVDPNDLARTLAGLTKRAERAGRLLRFIAATGCRPDEARRMEWRDVSIQTGTCILNHHKASLATGRSKTIYLTKAAVEILDEIENREGVVFPSNRGMAYTASGLRAILQRHAPGITPYMLRHTFAQVASEQMSEQDLAKLMGHSNTRTTRHYYSVKDQRARMLAAQLVLPQTARVHDESQRQNASSASPRPRPTQDQSKANRKARGAKRGGRPRV